jgi:hypothetical protein
MDWMLVDMNGCWWIGLDVGGLVGWWVGGLVVDWTGCLWVGGLVGLNSTELD